VFEDVEKRIKELMGTNLRRVVNATGVVVNTNLGRAPLHPEVASFMEHIATGYSNLEYDLTEGERSRREKHVEDYLLELTGAQSVLLVNNNAAAVFLVLNSDIMRSSGAVLREVGTTNRTRLSDYETAIGNSTALILKVHRSNFYMKGFVEEVSLGELASLAGSRGIPLYYDCGSGLLVDPGLGTGEKTFRESLEDGADVVSGSGDKLLGGPQAGVIAGRRDLLENMRRNPLVRALRVDKLTLAGLEMTLKLYAEGRHREIPVIRMLTEDAGTLRRRALRLSRLVKGLDKLRVRVLRDVSRPGGGAFPELELPTYCVALEHPEISAGDISRRLRESEPPVVGRVRRDNPWRALSGRLWGPGKVVLIASDPDDGVNVSSGIEVTDYLEKSWLEKFVKLSVYPVCSFLVGNVSVPEAVEPQLEGFKLHNVSVRHDSLRDLSSTMYLSGT